MELISKTLDKPHQNFQISTKQVFLNYSLKTYHYLYIEII